MKKISTVLTKSGAFIRRMIMRSGFKSLILVLLQIGCARISAQIITFQKVYSCTGNRSGTGVLQTSDGGYMVVGSTEDNIPNDLNVILMKTNSYGDTVWHKMYGGARPDYANNVLATNDGNYFSVGGTQSFGGGDLDVYLIKFTSSGDTLWTRHYGGNGNEDGTEIVSTADGNYVIVGTSNSANLSNYQAQLTKIDPSGNVIWMKYYGGSNFHSARSVKLCADGGFILTGRTAATYSSAISSMYLIRTNAAGDTLWTKTYGGPDSYEGKSVVVNNDGSYTIALDDSSASRDSDVRISKFDPNGAKLWSKVYGGLKKDICKMIEHTNDGGYIVAAISRSFGWVNPDMWILKLDAMGDTMWTRHFGGSGHEHCYAAKQTADGGYVAVGLSRSWSPNTEIMLVKVDGNGNFNGTMSVQNLLAAESVKVYPNPSIDRVVIIDIDDGPAASVIKIRNAAGQEVFSQAIEPGSGRNRKFDLGEKPSGIYFVTLQTEKSITTRKLILE